MLFLGLPPRVDMYVYIYICTYICFYIYRYLNMEGERSRCGASLK